LEPNTQGRFTDRLAAKLVRRQELFHGDCQRRKRVVVPQVEHLGELKIETENLAGQRVAYG
jgi:hypothetical protein